MQLPGLGRIGDRVSQDAWSGGARAFAGMSLPGLGLSVVPEAQSCPLVVHELKEGAEWRFEVAFGTNVEVKVFHLGAGQSNFLANSNL